MHYSLYESFNLKGATSLLQQSPNNSFKEWVGVINAHTERSDSEIPERFPVLIISRFSSESATLLDNEVG